MLSGIIFINLKLKEMKKILTVLAIVLFSTIGYSQIDSTSYVTDSNVEKLVDKYSAKIEATIVSLAEQLKQPAEHIYKIMVKQQVVNSIAWLIIGLLCISTAFTRKFWLNRIEKEQDDDMGWVMGLILLCIVPSMIGITVLIVQSETIVTGFINPEYGAIQDIINLIK